jgi:hypothetical protein
VIKETVSLDSTTGPAQDLVYPQEGVFPGKFAMMSEEVVAG